MINIFLKLLKDSQYTILNKIQNCKNYDEFKSIRDEVEKKNGTLDTITEKFKKLSPDEKKEIGNTFQQFKKIIIDALREQETILKEDKPKKKEEDNTSLFNPSLEPSFETLGNIHLYTSAINDIYNYFTQIGFEVVDGPIIETEEFNFSFLNIPEDHPARGDSDTFWLKENNLALRTQTSSIQVREARKRKAPFGIVAPGRVFRNEATDASHDYMFYQLEGLFLSRDASLSTLLYTIEKFLCFFFNNDTLKIRTRPFSFPFVEPGLEIDLQCPFCSHGCSTCKQTQWIEIAGSGMVHPNVLKHMNQEDEVRGWAFGFGLTRLVMLKYNISDIRLLHS
jgi:phenylalanyl-tRNA synthetase alpha chain